MAKRKRGTGGREYGKMPLSGQDHLAAGQKGAVGAAANGVGEVDSSLMQH
jgi:hypothetical protein